MTSKIGTTAAALARLPMVAAMIVAMQGTPSIADDSLRRVEVAHWGQSRVLIYLPFYVAIERGLFADEGIEVEVVYSGNDDQVFASVVNGSAIAGLADPAFAAVSRERGGSGRVIAVLVERVANWGVGRLESVPKKDFRHLEGTRVSSFPSPSTAYSILTDLRESVGIQEMSIVELSPGSEIAALEKGGIDVALAGEPAVSIAEEAGYTVALSLAAYYGPFAFSGITTTDQNIGKFSRELQALVSGLQRAIELIGSDPDVAVEVAVASFPSISKGVLARAVRRLSEDHAIPNSVAVSSEAWSRTIDLRHRIGDLARTDHTGAVFGGFAEVASDAALRAADRERRLDEFAAPGLGSASRWADLSRFADVLTVLAFLPLVFAGLQFILWNRRLARAAGLRAAGLSSTARTLLRVIGEDRDQIAKDDAVREVSRETHRAPAEVASQIQRLKAEGYLKEQGVGAQATLILARTWGSRSVKLHALV